LIFYPPDLGISLAFLDKESLKDCLTRLRRDPVSRQLERVFRVSVVMHQRQITLEHKKRGTIIERLPTEPKMLARFFELGDQYYLRDLLPGHAGDYKIDKGEVAIRFEHDCNQKSYIAVHVDAFGITNIAFTSKAGIPHWLRPDAKSQKSEFFQDEGDGKCHNSLCATSDAS
jgi:hypothetical protein